MAEPERKTAPGQDGRSFSQWGEDIAVLDILDQLDTVAELDGWCVEFGAWDGVHLSNTCKLIRDRDYKAVLIEGDARKVAALRANFSGDRVTAVNQFVAFDGPLSLDNLLQKTEIPKNFDFLSIDVDGNDYHIWDSIQVFRPKIVCIEFNPNIPNRVCFVQEKRASVKHGSSGKALVKLAHHKNYSLVLATPSNLIFVEEELSPAVQKQEPRLENIFPDGNDETIIFAGYDGSILSNKPHLGLGWHEIVVPIAKLQFFPKFLRKFYDDYTIFERITFFAYVATRLPRLTATHWRRGLALFRRHRGKN